MAQDFEGLAQAVYGLMEIALVARRYAQELEARGVPKEVLEPAREVSWKCFRSQISSACIFDSAMRAELIDQATVEAIATARELAVPLQRKSGASLHA